MMSSEIVKEARTWLGTPFHHQARTKQVGCDCIGLVASVAKSCGLKAKDGSYLRHHDCTDYTKLPVDYHLKNELAKLLHEKSTDEIAQGNVLLFAFDAYPQHVGIVSQVTQNKMSMIHAYEKMGKVIEHPLDQFWQKKITHCFAFST